MKHRITKSLRLPRPYSSTTYKLIVMLITFWLSEVSSGTSFMDALHKDCVDTLIQLPSTQDGEFQSGYNRLLKKVERAFRTEEHWMEEIDFCELKHHREQHASILSTLYAGQSRIMSNDVDFGRNLIENLLPEWLLLHATTMDSALASELQHAICS